MMMEDAHAAGSSSTLDKDAAIEIYWAKASCSPRDGTSSALAKKYNITMKAVRDVWNLRTWSWSTMPYWTSSDLKKFLRKHLCSQCKSKGVQTMAAACAKCSHPRRRGRPLQAPPGASLRSDAAASKLTSASDSPGQTAQHIPLPNQYPLAYDMIMPTSSHTEDDAAVKADAGISRMLPYHSRHSVSQGVYHGEVLPDTTIDGIERSWHQASSMQKPVFGKYTSYGAPIVSMLPYDAHQYVSQGDAPVDASLGKSWHNQASVMQQSALARYQASEAYDAPSFSMPPAHHAASTLLSSSWVPASLVARSTGSGPEFFNPWSSLPPCATSQDVGSVEATTAPLRRAGSPRISASMDAPPPSENSFARIGSISTDFARVTSAEDRAFARLLSGGVDYAHPMSLSHSPAIFPPSTSTSHFNNLNEPLSLAASSMHPPDPWPHAKE
jgi:hypothetical protein